MMEPILDVEIKGVRYRTFIGTWTAQEVRDATGTFTVPEGPCLLVYRDGETNPKYRVCPQGKSVEDLATEDVKELLLRLVEAEQ